MITVRQISREDWPELVNFIAEIIGDDSAMDLFENFAGCHLFIPSKPNKNNKISELIGHEKANLLIKNFSNECVVFPNCSNLIRKYRNDAIIEDINSGIKRADIAKKYQLTERQLLSIFKNRNLKNTTSIKGK